MSDENIQPIKDPREIPSGLSDEEQLAYWESHGLTEEYLQKTEEVPDKERPRARTSPISVRFDAHTLNRLKNMADRRGVGYQTLLKEFVIERLYEEERREGFMPFDSAKASKAAFADAFNTTCSLLQYSLVQWLTKESPENLRPADISAAIEDAFRKGWSRANPYETEWDPWEFGSPTLGIQGRPEEQRHYPAKQRDTN
jgi:predicted DNA binding CopG/RHH family protein